MQDFSTFITNLLLIIFSLISFLMCLMIILIHSRQSFFRQGFFIIVLIQIILEAFINLVILVMNIIYIFEIKRDFYFLIFPIFFNFFYTTNILYNSSIIIYLMSTNIEKDELINYESNDDSDKEGYLSRSSTVVLIPRTFKFMHIFPILISLIHSFLYIFSLYNANKEEFKEPLWYTYFLDKQNELNLWNLFFFIFNIIYFFLSIIYFLFSLNKEKISNHIFLKEFSIYCLFNSLVSIIFPISLILKKFEVKKEIFLYIFIFVFLIYFLSTFIFRIGCYYVQNILGNNGNGFIKKFIYGLRILFCCQKIKEPDFIDLNSSYIYHSLANNNDFALEIPSETSSKK